MEASESEKVIQQLNQELQEANEQANSGKRKCIELQGKRGTLKQLYVVVCIIATLKSGIHCCKHITVELQWIAALVHLLLL